MSDSQQELGAAQMRRVAFASLSGTTIEWYDFYIYGTAAALVFPTLFFPGLGSAAALIASFATFGVAFVARPLGAVVFGHYGDRIGRKRTLVVSLLLMGIATLVVGVLPTAGTIGVAAPVILVLMRLAQGLAVGGEWAGAALLTAENAPAAKRGHYGMYPQLGPGIALVLSSATYLAAALFLTDGQFMAWGWRIPFLVSIALIAVGLWIRLTIEETTSFKKVRSSDAVVRLPFADVFRHQWREVLLVAGALTILFASFYLGVSYLTSYASTELGLERTAVLTSNIVAGVVFAVTTIVAAKLSDRVGRKTLVIAGNVFATGWALVVFRILDGSGAVSFTAALSLTMVGVGLIYGPVGSYVPELFATRYRYTGAGVAYSLAGILGGSIPPVIAASLAARFGTPSIGIYLAAMGLLSIACVARLSDTRAKVLDGSGATASGVPAVVA
ncbi:MULTISPECIES: MFS transporter [unclassified Nocardioides]|uniref:MFS transporter n=1 Tax=unclassified Nocardioides TaxID=2615069 RepID=UPI0006F2F3B6|nr:MULTISPECIES: MFS transporter [unclassified Nocardioides]KQY57607.1 MFS transporter [Nocardioides sp. Root140]KRF15097.1 MFS transporter [Nocardioides sp. Soil796]